MTFFDRRKVLKNKPNEGIEDYVYNRLLHRFSFFLEYSSQNRKSPSIPSRWYRCCPASELPFAKWATEDTDDIHRIPGGRVDRAFQDVLLRISRLNG
jgi:hypothetical protein